jgi:hypothetical protein
LPRFGNSFSDNPAFLILLPKGFAKDQFFKVLCEIFRDKEDECIKVIKEP